jgi:hypothetical protein
VVARLGLLNGMQALSLTPCAYFATCSVVENTKEYICRAVVSVVDHLGTVSTNLNCCISQTNAFSEAELRISCLKQVYVYIYILFLLLIMHVNQLYIYIDYIVEKYKAVTSTPLEICSVL